MQAFTAGTALQAVTDIERVFTDLKKDISASPLRRALDEVSWLASHGERLWRTGGILETEPVRAQAALRQAFRANAVAVALNACKDCVGFREQLGHLRKMEFATDIAGTPFSATAMQAWEHFLEIEVAGWFASAAETRFAEPDVVLRWPGGMEFGIACKRPRAPQAISDMVWAGAEQIARSGRAGAVFVLGDVLVDRYFPARHERDACRMAQRWFGAVASARRGEIRRVLARTMPFDGALGLGVTGAVLVAHAPTVFDPGVEGMAGRAPTICAVPAVPPGGAGRRLTVGVANAIATVRR